MSYVVLYVVSRFLRHRSVTKPNLYLAYSYCIICIEQSKYYHVFVVISVSTGLRYDGGVALHLHARDPLRVVRLAHRFARWRYRRCQRFLHRRSIFRPETEEDGIREHLVLVRLRSIHAQPLQQAQDVLQDPQHAALEGDSAARGGNRRRLVHVVCREWPRHLLFQVNWLDIRCQIFTFYQLHICFISISGGF